MRSKKYSLQVLLHIPALKTILTRYPVKYTKSLVLCLQLFQRVNEVFSKYLGYLLVTSSYYEPLE